MNKICVKVLFFAGLGLLLTVNTSLGETGFVNTKEFGVQPSFPGDISMVRTHISCYDAFTLRELDCAFTHKVIGIKKPVEDIENNGGHAHNFDTHPLIEPRDGALEFSGVDSDPSKLGIKGQTRNTSVVLTHPMPQASGKIVTETLITAPFGWRCSRGCFTENSFKYEFTYNVGIFNMKGIGSSSDFHVVLRGGTDTHPEGTYGTPATTEQLMMIAKEYFEQTDGRKLSINDLSLPTGGVFDLCSTYNPSDTCSAAPNGGHIEHRTGTDADLNRCDGSGQFCPLCKFLQEVVGEIAEGRSRPRLNCESEGRKHIDFD
jgi:hypothetical protein